MTLSGTVQEIEKILYAMKDSNNNKVVDKVFQGSLNNSPMAGKTTFSIQADRHMRVIDFQSSSLLLGPKDVVIYIYGYIAGPKDETILRLYDLAELTEKELAKYWDNFNHTCTSTHRDEEYLKYGEDSSLKGLYVGFEMIIICNYSNNE